MGALQPIATTKCCSEFVWLPVCMHTGEFLKVEWLHQRISVFKDEGEKEYVGERVLDHRVTKGEMEYTLKCPVCQIASRRGHSRQ